MTQVAINTERPRKGTFEVRVTLAGGEPTAVLSLLAMKRPFPALKALDMEEEAEKVVKACR